jgi:alkylated DNA repair dioxygenase AlkB
MEQLDLFGSAAHHPQWPEDIMEYHSGIFSRAESIHFLQNLIDSVTWEQRIVTMYGKQIITPRLTAWYGDPGKNYAYTGGRFKALPWTEALRTIKGRVEPIAGRSFNSVLLNYYRDANDSVAWHSDNETELGPQPLVGSVSFGQVRRFDVRLKTDHTRKYAINLESGSLLLMKGNLQRDWEHRIAKSTKPMTARLNLTFRIIN